jgi:SPW repeat
MGSIRYDGLDGAPVVDERRRTVSRVVNAVVFLAAVWLTVSADPVAYVGTGRFDVFWNHAVIGLAVGAVALVRVAKPAGTGALALTNSLLGVWLMMSPFWYGYGGGRTDALALWNDVLVGGTVLVLTLTTAALRDRGSDEVPPLGDTDGWQLR